MKTSKYTLLLAACAIAACAKTNDDSANDHRLPLVESKVTFTSAGGSGSIVADTGAALTAEADKTWCKAAVSGNKVTVTVDANNTIESRAARITLRSDGRSNAVSVYQSALDIDLSATALSVNCEAQTASIDWKCAVELVAATSNQPWVTPTISDGKINLAVQRATSLYQSRSAVIKVAAKGGAAVENIALTQSRLEPPAGVNTVAAFLNLKNNAGTSSRYKITQFYGTLGTYFKNLKDRYPVLKEVRIEAPRGTNKMSIIWVNDSSTFYWNYTNGFTSVTAQTARFPSSAVTHSGGYPAYRYDPNHENMKATIEASTGFTFIPDGTSFWIRSNANPAIYFRAEPATW